ncbi:MAG: hypothetical protein KC910_17660 [Candidatus Eremiobacteraeota bacterium]|nr:hypothetical protein [Candidatus Eremiobacteraeota bacterium]
MSSARAWVIPQLSPTGRREPEEPTGSELALLDEAVEQARDIRETARREAARERQTARTRGYAEGLAAGRADALETYQRELEQREERFRANFEVLQESAEARWKELCDELSQSVVELAQAMMAKLVGPEHMANLPVSEVRRAVELFGDVDDILVKVHPLSLNLAGPVTRGFRLEGDENLDPGDFIVVSPRGQVDGRVVTRQARLAAWLEDQTTC